MKLVVGLGNPGEKYEKNRHNIGFLILEKIAQKEKITFRLESMYNSRYAEMASLDSQGEVDARRGSLENRIKLVQPQTFMNDSGLAVEKTKNYYKVDSEDIWVIHDDVDLDMGKIRIQLGGSSAGHKGVQSIIDHIGDQFWRIRVGVGRSEDVPTESWVLMNFDDENKLTEIVDKVAEIVLESLSNEIKEQTINIK